MNGRYSRRQVVLGAGALVAATTGTVALGSQNTTATVSGDFSIPNGQTVLADTTLQDVRLEVAATYGYEANAPIHGVELELHVGASSDTLDLISRTSRDDLGTDSLTGEETLNGSLMSADDFSIDDFRPATGELRRTVIAELRFYAIRNDEVVAEARQTTTFDVVVSNEELRVDVTLGGSGSVTFDTD